MKFLVLALGLLSAVATSQHVQASNTYPVASLWRGGAGPEVPFPLSAQVDFPWESIEGVWLAKSKGINALFSFRVQSDANNNRILKVVHLDPDTQGVIAEGTGFSGEDSRMVRAGMITMAMGGQNYWLVIRAYKLDKSQKLVTRLTLRPVGGGDDSDIDVVVRKISSVPFDDSKVPPAPNVAAEF